jgi:transcriptional regulator with XRE-family HTH domain
MLRRVGQFEDETDRARLIATLVHLRVSRGITQADVARRMGVTQHRVSAFESLGQEGGDFQVTTVQRYARAIGVELRMWIEPKEPELVEPPGAGTGGSGEEATP